MTTEIAIDGEQFLINGRPTYEGVSYRGKKIEGLLFNSRMIQAVFDDECPATRERWRYPDTGVWDPERNTDEFCAALPEYRRHGLLAVTVGLQGGGSVYTKDIYDSYDNSAYRADGSFKQPYFQRLERVLRAADDAGMAVIVNYFYFKHFARLRDDATIESVTERVTDWLLRTGYRNILVDVFNESNLKRQHPLTRADGVHRLIEIAQGVTLDGRRLYVSTSSGGGDSLPMGQWLEREDFSMPHGNGCTPERLREKLRRLKAEEAFRRRPRPIAINEDSVFTENMDAAIDEYVSWGYYHQGYGSVYKDRYDWTTQPRESRFEDLSGFQTVPVNWSINDPVKRRFFDHLREVTQGR